MESKISEMESTSLNQRRRTTELEKQVRKSENVIKESGIVYFNLKKKTKTLEVSVRESENVVKDLQGEFKKMQNKLEIMQNKAVVPLKTVLATEPRDSSFDKSQPLSYFSKINSRKGRSNDRRMHTSSINNMVKASQRPPLSRSNTYRSASNNGQNLEELNVSENYLASASSLNTRKISSWSGSVDGVQTEANMSKKRNVKNSSKEKIPMVEEVLQKNRSCDRGQVSKPFIKVSCRKERSNYINMKNTSSIKQVVKACERSTFCHCKKSPCECNDNENPSRLGEDGEHRTSESHLALLSSFDTTKVDSCLGCGDGVDDEAKLIQKGSTNNTLIEAKMMVDEEECKKEKENAESSGLPNSKLNLGTVCVASAKSHKRDDETNSNRALNQSRSDGFLKYTFERKRKRGCLDNPKMNSVLESKVGMRRSTEKQKNGPEPQDFGLIVESAWESQQLMEVASLLMEFSEDR